MSSTAATCDRPAKTSRVVSGLRVSTRIMGSRTVARHSLRSPASDTRATMDPPAIVKPSTTASTTGSTKPIGSSGGGLSRI